MREFFLFYFDIQMRGNVTVLIYSELFLIK